MGQKEKCPAKKNQEHFLSDLNKYILPIWISTTNDDMASECAS